ncbi:PhzF family phenazine biosynthesis isomerase [Streptomyces sp. NPDC007325]|uniref:PhzF family phenazine biosynthesis isomerase n=1 Tax=Streptomyces sp. NPDC007325 TaxID=3154588 RepID=UPI0033E0A117
MTTSAELPASVLAGVLRYTAFSADPEGGNPAGIVLDAAHLDEALMLATAAAVGYSETAFVTSRDDHERRFTLRYFSPLAEVDFCGHATIATAVALAERLGAGPLTFDTPAGEIPIATTADANGLVRATLTSVPTHSRPTPDADVDAALATLRWRRSDLDPALPPHIAFGGENHLVLAAVTRARLADLDYDFDALAALMRDRDWTTVHLVWREDDTTYHARDPFPVGGVVEDAATGAAAAAFGGYLRTLDLLPATGALTLHQGEDMGRPSHLTVTATPADPRVQVSGTAVPISA